MKPGRKGLARLYYAFFYSISGFKSAFKNEAAIRQETVVCSALFAVACFLPISVVERCFLFTTCFALFGVELVNTAIEAVVDRISPEKHPLSKMAKDVGSALVLLTIAYMALIWILIGYGVVKNWAA